jgi:hypothetical protein
MKNNELNESKGEIINLLCQLVRQEETPENTFFCNLYKKSLPFNLLLKVL